MTDQYDREKTVSDFGIGGDDGITFSTEEKFHSEHWRQIRRKLGEFFKLNKRGKVPLVRLPAVEAKKD